MRNFSFLVLMLSGLMCHAQFPPPAGQTGTTAIPFDSTCFKFWADSCQVTRGYVNIFDTTVTYEGKNRAFYGNDTDALGLPDEYVVSLGDGGIAWVTFPVNIGNGPGFDFAVFENGLGDTFLELGFTEVSSDGQRFVRFPAITHVQTETQVSTFGSTDATLINNFAGKYRAFYGTPFDLDDIKDSTGIDLQHITTVRIIDVVGCLQPGFATFDAEGTMVNDPWPTPFHSCGFDLDAVGVINIGAQGTGNAGNSRSVILYPNPVTDFLSVSCGHEPFIASILAMNGSLVIGSLPVNGSGLIPMSSIPPGLYICRMVFDDGSVAFRKVMKR